MSEALELLDQARILAGLTTAVRQRLNRLDVFPVLDSTNTWLLTGAAEGWPGGAACLADQQTTGRGRQGRQWLTPPGASLALSLLWRFERSPAALGGLGLAVGMAIAQALRDQGVAEVSLKWPNDIGWRGRKLGGILLESGGSVDRFYVVAGIGLNVALPREISVRIDQPWVDLQTILGAPPARNALAAALINAVVSAFVRFDQEGFAGFVDEWPAFDQVQGRRVQLHLPAGVIKGIARGVDQGGALLLETPDGQITPFLGGEISLRMDAA